MLKTIAKLAINSAFEFKTINGKETLLIKQTVLKPAFKLMENRLEAIERLVVEFDSKGWDTTIETGSSQTQGILETFAIKETSEGVQLQIGLSSPPDIQFKNGWKYFMSGFMSYVLPIFGQNINIDESTRISFSGNSIILTRPMPGNLSGMVEALRKGIHGRFVQDGLLVELNGINGSLIIKELTKVIGLV